MLRRLVKPVFSWKIKCLSRNRSRNKPCCSHFWSTREAVLVAGSYINAWISGRPIEQNLVLEEWRVLREATDIVLALQNAHVLNKTPTKPYKFSKLKN